MHDKNNTVLVLGSGPLRIGQAAEFDYAGSQACRALREEGCAVVLLNSNPATIQTDDTVADVVLLRPLLPEVVEEILQTYRPRGVVATLGGQTALNLCVACEEAGLWKRHGCEVLGTSPKAIARAESREAFRQTMVALGQPVPPSVCVASVGEAERFAATVPLPLIVRPDFTLGGSGNGVVRHRKELALRVEEGLRASPVERVLVERYLEGWREIEAEVVRDGAGNALCVCGMENVDPMGVHTGDSVVVAPVLTLTDRQWQRLRGAALAIAGALEVRGACNVQFALSPDGEEYAVIEVNPRASRSSALASKATGYPIARVAARIALGRLLTELPNPVTGAGSALAEPALDYVVLKIPAWPFDAFPGADEALGTRMKATGEILALGASFAQALLKGYRSLEGGDRWHDPRWHGMTEGALWHHVLAPTHRRLESMGELLRRGVAPEELGRRTGIHPYFVAQLLEVVEGERRVRQGGASAKTLGEGRRLGFGVERLAALAGLPVETVEHLLAFAGYAPAFREVDGCAGESPAGSGYFYSVPGGVDELPGEHAGGVAVLGSGAIRIAQGMEFDYCCVKAVEALRRRGVRGIMVNCNPETVSTDADISDALYVEPLTPGDVLPVLRRERVRGVLACFGGQTSLRLGQALDERGVLILGPSPRVVFRTEDRGEFASLLKNLGIPQPPGRGVRSLGEAWEVVEELGFPLMVRPSFVLGGVAMGVAHGKEEFGLLVSGALAAVPDQTVLLDKFLAGQEFEVDALGDGEDVFLPGVFEHLDPAGIHSGDSIAHFPDISLSSAQRQEIQRMVTALSGALELRGLLNVQFVLHQGRLHVIEANPRASRTVPMGAKVAGVPLVDRAVGMALGERLRDSGPLGWGERPGKFGVKVPVFSTEKLPGIDPRLGPRMLSTGEALGLGTSLGQALAEGFRGAGWRLPPAGRVFFSVRDGEKEAVGPVGASFAALGWHLSASPGTAEVLRRHGVPVETVARESVEARKAQEWDLVVNVAGTGGLHEGMGWRRRAVEAGVPYLGSLEAAWGVWRALAFLRGDPIQEPPGANRNRT
ncbi:MAG TPA: carbamoyl-phosphate synthase large subunit [Synergistaceae bacterium]|nr:carbamoyl-phosphate synthase large subunit [Synergistaceae bacterium]HQH78894.1 carbamoyl-phosphate synthase large subunit [Synergistaceae bacterium]